MPTDAELRTLFRESSAPAATIDATTVIRRSRRRRLPQQLGVGSALTLAVAGIGVASITGLQGLSPSMMAADAPAGVAESGPLSGADMTTRSTCTPGAAFEGESNRDVEVASDFPASAQSGETVPGVLTLTNTGSEEVAGTVASASVTLTGAGVDISQRDASSIGTTVSLPPGGTMSVEVSFDTIGCDATSQTDGLPVVAGSYDISAALTLESADGTLWLLSAPASSITIR